MRIKNAMPWDPGAMTATEIAKYEERLTDEQKALFKTFRDIAHARLTEFKEAELKESAITKKMIKKLSPGWHTLEFKSPVTGKMKTLNVLKQ